METKTKNTFTKVLTVITLIVITNATNVYAIIDDSAIISKLQEVVTAAENALKVIFAGWGMYGITLAGIKYFNSEEEAAKKAMMHVLIALILFALTSPILEMFGLK